MIVDVGDTPTLTWRLRDDDGEPIVPTLVVADVRDPAGQITSLTVGSDGPGNFSVQPPITVEGDWRVTWRSVGPDQVEVVGIHAFPAGEAAVWAPTLRQVAVHIPSRTRSQDSYGDDVNRPLGTFTEDTYPTGDDVSRLIGASVAVVSGMVGRPVVTPAYGLASAATALWAAYWAELSWPERDADVSLAQRLREDALLLVEQAKAVNLGAGGGTENQPDPDGLPDRLVSFSFPAPGPPLIL
ncbi:hypothetical protein [Kineosporia babensis]|uniref:Uncharacterized protein n=1 Tax=Kineosporia babensis TaxID=499548 RepID=A0A9X1NBJ0_9ACTN|nr:hypothetical protein [Kineosporia babensis]MCD5310799.1 hypothetical protein [Kineosporia babensis]